MTRIDVVSDDQIARDIDVGYRARSLPVGFAWGDTRCVPDRAIQAVAMASRPDNPGSAPLYIAVTRYGAEGADAWVMQIDLQGRFRPGPGIDGSGTQAVGFDHADSAVADTVNDIVRATSGNNDDDTLWVAANADRSGGPASARWNGEATAASRPNSARPVSWSSVASADWAIVRSSTCRCTGRRECDRR